VGAGFVAQALRSLEGKGLARLVSVTSKREASASHFASDWGLESWFTNHNEMFRKAKLDIAIVCTPHYLHFPVALDSIENGLHTLVDKPLAINLAEADTLIREAKRAGVKLGTILEFRFSEPVRRLRELLKMEGLGKLVLGEAQVEWYRDENYYMKSTWRGRRSTEGGGALINQGIHTLDLLIHLMGDVEEVYAKCGTFAHSIEVEDLAVSLMRFASGAFGIVTASTAMSPGFPTRLEVHGTKGSATIEGEKLISRLAGGVEELAAIDKGLQAWARPEAVPPKNHALLIEDFVSAVLENREPLVNGEEGRRSVELIRAIYASARRNQVVTLPFSE
jgi:UDP-N-acetyl-2-amino-2-deoxyglucuronate dehydrogenase